MWQEVESNLGRCGMRPVASSTKKTSPVTMYRAVNGENNITLSPFNYGKGFSHPEWPKMGTFFNIQEYEKSLVNMRRAAFKRRIGEV